MTKTVTFEFVEYLRQIEKITNGMLGMINPDIDKKVSVSELSKISQLEENYIEDSFSTYESIARTSLDSIDTESVALISEDFCINEKVIPFALSDDMIMVAIHNILDPSIVETISQDTGLEVEPFYCSAKIIEAKQQELYAKNIEFRK